MSAITTTAEPSEAPGASPWVSMLSLAREDSASLDVPDLAAAAGYSPFHFARLFRARMGISPGRFLTMLQIDAAKRLLLEDDSPVIDVATAVGFDSLSSFSRRFRSTVGVPPGGLRRLADDVADHPPRPFSLLERAAPSPSATVTVRLELPASVGRRGDASVWVGWYPQPAPIGLPTAGLLVRGEEAVALPLCPGAPFLLGFAVPAHADPQDHLLPEAPIVAAHPEPLTAPLAVPLAAPLAESEQIVLRFAPQPPERSMPMLSALPSLCRSAGG